jgi:hypothetical protein
VKNDVQNDTMFFRIGNGKPEVENIRPSVLTLPLSALNAMKMCDVTDNVTPENMLY